MTRIYQSIELQSGNIVRLDQRASHHLAHVLRANLNDQITMFNGSGGEFQAVISQINKKGVEVKIGTFIKKDMESPLNLHLAQGIARGEKMDFIIQKAVELGVKSITPVITERGNVRLQGEREQKRLQHWEGVVISACEQCGRNELPKMFAPMPFAAWIGSRASGDEGVCFILSPHATEKLLSTLAQHTKVTLLIGPEGGFSEAEMLLAQKHRFLPLNLGPRVLRTETATIAAITALQCRYGDMA